MKKLLSMFLCAVLLTSLAVSAVAEMAPMTDKEITLTYACWGQGEAGEPEVLEALMKQFEEAHPNINVEFVSIDQGTWNEALTNLAATGNLPDVFWAFSITGAVANEWALDLTEFYENDPDVKEMFPDIVTSTRIGGRNYCYPTVMFPHIMFMNKTLFDKYNVALPSYDWTVEEYFELAEELSHPEEYYFGVSNPLYEDFFPGWFNGQSKWGWDGENFHFDDAWAESLDTKWELIANKVCEWMSADEKSAVLGDPAAWPPGKGRTAMHIDWPWTLAFFNNVVAPETGCEFVYYPLPLGETGKELAIIDYGVISAGTEHPREAWELAKWMSWGSMAALKRQETYRATGNAVSRMPVVTTEAVWQDLVDNAADNIKGFYENVRSIIPSSWQVAPGWGQFETWMNENDIYGKIERGELNPADLTEELTTRANQFKDEYIAALGK